jgi:hypothetical protein
LQESRVTGREFEKLARKHLLPHLPGVALKGGDLYALPVDRLWRRLEPVRLGFSRESFTIVCSVSPLYVPETIHAYPTGLGDRLPILAGVGDRWWEWTPAAEQSATEMMRDVLAMIQDVGVPFLNKLATPEAVAQKLAQNPSRPDDPHTVEALAYSLILSGAALAPHLPLCGVGLRAVRRGRGAIPRLADHRRRDTTLGSVAARCPRGATRLAPRSGRQDTARLALVAGSSGRRLASTLDVVELAPLLGNQH